MRLRLGRQDILDSSVLLYAAYGTLAYIIVYLLDIYLTFFKSGAYTAPLYALEILLSILTYAGWFELGSRFKNQLLQNISLVAVFLVPVAGVLSALFSMSGEIPILLSGVTSVIMGLLVTSFGYALLRLYKDFGTVARVTGWLDIAAGISLVSILLIPLSILLNPVVLVLEALILLQAYEKVEKKSILSKLAFWRR